jgi:GxxExxY protein
MATRTLPVFRVNQVTGAVVSAAMKVHSMLGPGLLESAYQACLAHELRIRGLHVAAQVGLPVVYEGERLDLGYRIDLLVESLVVVEIKCAEAIHRPSGAVAFVHAVEWKACRPSHQLLCRPSERRHQAHGNRGRLGEVTPTNTGEHRGAQDRVFLCVPLW